MEKKGTADATQKDIEPATNPELEQGTALPNENIADSIPEQRESTAGEHEAEFPIVGIGASAGGLEALKEFFEAMPKNPGIAIIVITHLDPSKESMMSHLLSRSVDLTVAEVHDSPKIRINTVYVIPPNKFLSISNKHLHLSKPKQAYGTRMAIDYFFRSLAIDQGRNSAAVVLSGTGSDGTLGAKAVKQAGGLVIAQSPDSAAHPGMPKSVIATGIVDRVLQPSEIASVLVSYARHETVAADGIDHLKQTTTKSTDWENILAILRTRTHFDFRGYKDATLVRRTTRRMGLLDIASLNDYCNYLREHDEEVQALKKDLLISVTDFFRDPQAWNVLDARVIEPLVRNKESDDPLRVWVPGCATGEEAFSVAMLIDSKLQAEQKHCALHLFASDVDKHALDYARGAQYPISIAADVPGNFLKRYFSHVANDHHYQVKKSLRELIVFAEQNLIGDPPFSSLDLICCRNLLIYLKPEIQKKLIALFHFALNEGGFLFLGNAESVSAHPELFRTVSKKWRIFRRLGKTRHELVEFPLHSQTIKPEVISPAVSKTHIEYRMTQLLQKSLLEWIAPNSVLIDRQWQILHFSGDTDRFLTHAPGTSTHDLLSKCRRGLRSKLRASVQKSLEENRTIIVSTRVEYQSKLLDVDLTIRPIQDLENEETLVLILFDEPQGSRNETGHSDRSTEKRVEQSQHDEQAEGQDQQRKPVELIDDDEMLRQMEIELNETKQELQISIHQLEASNEELKASSEEVMSINEELQSTNEELETSKEELQSLNEELNTVNSQLANKVDELQDANNDLHNLISSTNIPTICLDRKMQIRWFTPVTRQLFNIVESDIGRPLSDFSHKLADADLLYDAKSVLEQLVPIEVEIASSTEARINVPQNDKSSAAKKTFIRRIAPFRTDEDRIDGVVITFIDITERKKAEALIAAKDLAAKIVDTVREPMLVLSADLKIISANQTFFQTFEVSVENTIGKMLYDLGNGQWDIAELRHLLERVVPNDAAFNDFEVEREFENIGNRIMMLNARRIDQHQLILLAIEDVTKLRRFQAHNLERIELLRLLQRVAESSNAAKTVEQAMKAALDHICQYNHWRLGHVWRLHDGGDKKAFSSKIWMVSDEWEADPDLVREFKAAVMQAENSSLVEQVVRSGEAHWFENLGDSSTGYLVGGRKLGLKSAIAFPVSFDSELVAILEFFSDQPMDREKRFMEIMPSIGLHLGHVVERKRLEKAIADASSEQQRHLGRELHDGVLQELVGLTMVAESVRQKLEEQPSPLTKQAELLVSSLRNVNEQVSRLSKGLRPVDVDASGLKFALALLVEHCDQIHEVQCQFICNEQVTLENNDVATHLYRIAQEAIQNSLKHSQPNQILVEILTDEGDLVLTIKDDGIGMPQPTSLREGIGLPIMQFRANLIGADLRIESGEGRGTTVTCRIPLNR
jgi:two-component system, chemotaxis family, CheB/CheR fusion protein